MEYLTLLLLGMLMSGTALLLPGMVNMTAVSVSIKQGFKAGILFGVGASVVMLIQAYLAVTFAGFLDRNPEIFLFLKRAAVVLFFLLSAVFLLLGLRPRAQKTRSRHGPPLLMGGLMAGMNALNIPFYFAAGTYLNLHGLINLAAPHNWFLLIGTFVGALAMMLGYAFFARIVASRIKALSKYMHFVLSGLFLLLGFMQLIELYFE